MSSRRPIGSLRALTAASLLVLAGCVSVGNERLKPLTRSSVERSLVQHQTTRQQIEALYGAPRSRSATASGETWTYMLSSTRIAPESLIPGVSIFTSGATSDGKVLTVVFDANGVLKDYTFTEAHNSYHRGL